MAPLGDEPILAQPTQPYSFGLEPAHNLSYSLLMLNRLEQFPGLDEWVPRMAARLAPDRLHRNQVVIEGLHQAIEPGGSYPSFLAYLDSLAATPPHLLRDRQINTLKAHYQQAGRGDPPVDPLASLDTYLAFLAAVFASKHFDPEIESEAYILLCDPPRMHEVILEHLRFMWSEALRSEWERTRPLLYEALQAFRPLDLSAMAAPEAIRAVVGQDLSEEWRQKLSSVERIIFVPSAHLGPYIGKMHDGATLRLLFGARQPDGAAIDRSALSRSELLVRLSALTDDTRLRVLALLAEREELCAPEIMIQLDLSQSAVSRHLRQLSAAGYVSERWSDGSKCYRLHRERISTTLGALRRFLGA